MYAEDSNNVRTVYITGKHREPQDREDKLISMLRDAMDRQHDGFEAMRRDVKEELSEVNKNLNKTNENISELNAELTKTNNKIDNLALSDKLIKVIGGALFILLLILGGSLGVQTSIDLGLIEASNYIGTAP